MINILNYLVQLLYNCLKTNEKKFVFTSYPDLSDNTFAFFLHIDQKYSFDPIWLINDYEKKDYYHEIIKKYFKNNPVKLVRKKSFKGIYHYLTAKFVFSTHGIYRIFGRIKGHNSINLWHGMPIKNIEHLDPKNNSLPDSSNFYVVTSDFYKKIFMKIFKTDEQSVLVTGSPRNDLLLNGQINLKSILEIKSKIKKTIMWMPTYSNFQKNSDYFFSETNLLKLDSFLIKTNTLCVIKKHPLDQTLDLKFDQFKNISIIDNSIFEKNKINFYEVFNSVDILLTDFSSVYIDFLLLNKPIGFTISNTDLYFKSRGIIFDNKENYMPGSILNNIDDIILFLNKIIINQEDLFFTKREKIKNLFHDIDKEFSNHLEKIIFNKNNKI